MQIFVLDILKRFFVRRHALEPAQRRHHGQQQMQLRMFRNQRLLKDHAFFRIEPSRQIIGGNLDHVLRNRGCIGVVARQRMPIRNEVEAVVGRIILQAHPIRQRAKIIPDMHATRGPHAAQDPALLTLSPCRHPWLPASIRRQKRREIPRFARNDGGWVGCPIRPAKLQRRRARGRQS